MAEGSLSGRPQQVFIGLQNTQNIVTGSTCSRYHYGSELGRDWFRKSFSERAFDDSMVDVGKQDGDGRSKMEGVGVSPVRLWPEERGSDEGEKLGEKSDMQPNEEQPPLVENGE